MAKAEACLSTNSAITVTDLNTTVNCEPRVHDLRLAEALGFSDRHMIRALIRRHLPVLRTFGEVSTERKKPSGSGGRPGTDYYLNKRQALFITAKSDTERAALVTVQMVEVFDQVSSGEIIPVKSHRRRRPALPGPVEVEPEPHDTGRGVIALDGRLVYFSATRKPQPGDPVLVIQHDGSVAIREMATAYEPIEPGLVAVIGAGPQHPGGRMSIDHVPLIGAIVSPSRMPGSSKPRPTDPNYPDAFEPGSDLMLDIRSLVLSALARVEYGQAKDFGSAMLAVLDDRRQMRDGGRARGVVMDWNDVRARRGSTTSYDPADKPKRS